MTAEVALHEDKTLYALVDDISAYHETLAMLDGQLAQPLEDDERAAITEARRQVAESIETIGQQLANKTDAIAVVLRRLAHERDYIHEERDRLKAKEAATERAEQWLRKYVVSVMQSKGIDKLKTASNTLFLRGTEAVEITDASAVPAVYQNAEVKLPLWLWQELRKLWDTEILGHEIENVRVKAEPSLSTIKKAIKAGENVEGADLRLNTSLVCR